MSDIADLRGVFPTALRWNAEQGFLGYSTFDEASGERELKQLELGTREATLIMDLARRERGYGKIKAGFYDMKLAPVGSPPPPWPGDDEYKPSIGCWTWSLLLGELRLETNAQLLVRTVSDL